MKTYNHLFDQITDFENLYQAAKLARKGKKETPAIIRFHFHLEKELFQLQQKLENRTYKPGKYRTFTIHDPKKRMISAAPYRDRVVHHALCRIIEPVFDCTFIKDSYANRVGKGVHAAIERYQQYAKQYPYVLTCDVKKFFPSIDHEILKKELRWKIRCKDTLWLIDTIIDHSNPQEPHHVLFPGDDFGTPYNRRKGLPIGNLTSQFWANVYMNRFDHFVKEELKLPGYIRYVDDWVAFSHSKADLHLWKAQIKTYLQQLRLMLHPNKSHIHPVEKGVTFLGYRVYPHYRTVKKQNTRRYRRFVKKKLMLINKGEMSFQELESGLNSYLGHIRFANSKRLESRLFQYIRDRGVSLVEHPRGSWRVLEQQ